MFAAALLLSAAVVQEPAVTTPAADAAWVAGLPELLTPGTAFRYQSAGRAESGEVLLVFSAAEAAANRDELIALEAKRDAAIDDGAADRHRWDIEGRIEERRTLVVHACESGRLSFRAEAIDFAAETMVPVVSHIPLSGVAGVLETEARYAERTGVSLPPRDSAPEPSPAGGDGAGE